MATSDLRTELRRATRAYRNAAASYNDRAPLEVLGSKMELAWRRLQAARAALEAAERLEGSA